MPERCILASCIAAAEESCLWMGMATPIYYTADMVRALPDDGNKYELA